MDQHGWPVSPLRPDCRGKAVRPTSILTQGAVRSGLREVDFHLRCLANWEHAYRTKQISAMRYRVELAAMEERFRQFAEACHEVADVCVAEQQRVRGRR